MKRDVRAAKVAGILSYFIAAILVILPFHELLAVWIGSNSEHLDLVRIWKEILISLMVPPVIWLVWRTAGLRTWAARSWVLRLYAVYFVLHLVLGSWALISHRVVASALIYSFIVNLRFIGFFLICAVAAAGCRFLKDNWTRLVIWPSVAVIVFGLLQKFVLPLDFLRHLGYGPKTIPAYQTVDADIHYRRIQSSLRGANPLGAYLVLIISTAIVGLKARWLRVLYLLAALITIFLTYSRSAWIGLVTSFAALIYLGGRKLSPRITTVFLMTIVLVAAGLYVFRGSQTVQDTLLHTSNRSTSALTSNEARTSALHQAASDVVHQPLGGGPGTAGPASARNTGHPARIAENYYLQIGQEVGIVGLVVFLVIILAVAKELWLRRADGLAKLLLASLVGISIINLISHAWVDDTLSLIWWGLAGIACAPVILKSKVKP